MASYPSKKTQFYRLLVKPRQAPDPRSAGYLCDAHALGLTSVIGLECQDLFFLQGHVGRVGLRRLAEELLSDPITQSAQWGRLLVAEARPAPGTWVVEVALRPGVTDPVAAQIVRAAGVLGIRGVEQACTGQRSVDAVLHTLPGFFSVPLHEYELTHDNGGNRTSPRFSGSAWKRFEQKMTMPLFWGDSFLVSKDLFTPAR